MPVVGCVNVTRFNCFTRIEEESRSALADKATAERDKAAAEERCKALKRDRAAAVQGQAAAEERAKLMERDKAAAERDKAAAEERAMKLEQDKDGLRAIIDHLSEGMTGAASD